MGDVFKHPWLEAHCVGIDMATHDGSESMAVVGRKLPDGKFEVIAVYSMLEPSEVLRRLVERFLR